MNDRTKCNKFTTTDTEAHNFGHQYIVPLNGQFEQDMRDAAAFFGCRITTLRSEVVELTSAELDSLRDASEI